MRLSELQNKDVIDMVTGEKIGNVVDAEISSTTGTIIKLIIYEKKGLISSLRAAEDTSITWGQIKKIGSDVILINRN